MTDWVVAIPTYDRPEAIKKKTLAVLKHYKIPKERIYLFVANEEEKRSYSDALEDDAYYGEIVVGKLGILNQRNFIIDYFPEGKEIVSIDDDIRSFSVFKGKTNPLQPLPSLIKLINEGFKLCKEKGFKLWGVYPNNSKLSMSDTISFDLKIIIAGFHAFINDKKLKHTLQNKEDYEKTLQYAIKYGGVVRFNFVCLNTTMYSPGGITTSSGEAKRKELNKKAIDTLMTRYPGLVRLNPRRPGEIILARKVPEDYRMEGGVKVEGVPDDDLKIERSPIRNRTAYNEAKEELLSLLRATTIPKIRRNKVNPETGKVEVYNREAKIGRIGRTENFGFGMTRNKGFTQFAANKKHPELFDALIKFGNQVVPKGFFYNAITLNHGVKAKKHIDGLNVGRSVIVGIGDYTGGDIYVFAPNGKERKSFPLKDNPLVFNGAVYPHQTAPFKGERYTMIFFRQKRDDKIPGKPTIGKGHIEDDEEAIDELIGGVFA